MWTLTANNYLPGGLLAIIKGKCRVILQEDQTVISQLGNWIITTFKDNNKLLAIINLCRLPCSLSKGPRCCVTQYNLKDGQVKNRNTYRKEIFQQIKHYITNNNIGNIIIGEDFNQNISVYEIRKFYDDIGVKDIHSATNCIDMNNLDNINISGRHPIDSIAVLFGIM